MFKKLTFILLSCSSTLYAQDVKKEVETVKTKMDAFTSKTGVITKFTDTKLPNLKTSYEVGETRIRKVISGSGSAYFYQIEKEGKYGTSTASIEYSDLIEVLKALKVLRSEVDKDLAAKPDYMENKFITADGFHVGYYINEGKATWYIRLEKYSSNSSLFINNGEIIETAFTEAKSKIDALKSGN